MSFVVKDHDINLLVSIVTAPEDDNHTILATNFKRYFIEKNMNNEVLEERMSELNAIRFPIRKVIKVLNESIPTKSSIALDDDQLKIELELNIIVNEQTQKSEKLKLYFNLNECKSIKEVSEYFMNGLVRSMIETVTPATKVSLPEPALMIKTDVIEMFGKDISKMLGAKTEKNPSQKLQKKTSDIAMDRKKGGLKTQAVRQMLKPQAVEMKQFEFKESDSQEIEFTEDIQPSSSTHPPEIPKKRKKLNVKF